MLKDFYKRFGLDSSKTMEGMRFINRCDTAVFNMVEKSTGIWCPEFLRWLSFQWGERFDTHIEKYDYREYIESRFNFAAIHQHNYDRCKMLLEAVYKYSEKTGNKASVQSFLNKVMPDILNQSIIDLSIRWENGQFLPIGAEELDKTLVEK